MATPEKHGLAKQFTRLIVLSGLASFLLLGFLQVVLNKGLRLYFDQPEVQQQASQRGGVMGNKAAHGISSLQALLYHYYTTKAPACPVFPPWFGLFTKSRWNGRAAACYNREK